MSSTVLARSLKARITLAMLAIFLLSLWALSYYASHVLRKDMERLLGEQQFSTVSLLAGQVNRELALRLGALETVAQMAGRTLAVGPAATQLFIEQLPVVPSAFSGGLYVVGSDGTVVADFPLLAERVGANYLDRDYISTSLKTGVAVISPPVIGKRSGAPVFVMAVPIRDAHGRVIGVLAGVTRLDGPDVINEIIAGRYGQSGGYVLVAARYRLVVTASDKRRVMETLPPVGTNPTLERFVDGYEGSSVVVSPLGVEDLASAKGVPLAGWYLMATLPTAEAFAPIKEMQRHMLLATLVLTLLAGGLTWWIVRRQLSPLLVAAKTLSALSASPQTPQILEITRQDEIGQLIDAFNQLLGTLGQRDAALREMEWKFQALFDNGPIAVAYHEMIYDDSGKAIDYRFLDANAIYIQLTGADPRGRTVREAFPGVENESFDWIASFGNVARNGEELSFEQASLSPKRWYQGIAFRYKPDHFAVAFLDVSEHKRAEIRLKLGSVAFTHAREGIMITAADGAILEVNDAFTRITGYPRDEVIGRKPSLMSSGRHEKEFFAALWRDLTEKGHWYGELWNRRKNGEIFASTQTISAVRDAQGTIRQYVALFSDVTAIKKHQKQLEHLAHYDALTTLPNRVLLADRLQQAMCLAQRRGQHLAVVYLDLDRFKSINDTHGHEVGDQLLIAVAGRMKLALREGDTLARLGGDEFVAILPDLDEVAVSFPMFVRLLAAAANPISIGDLSLQVSASLGVTFYPQDDDIDADQLLRQADQAMYQAKQTGKNRYHLFDAEQDRNVRGHHESREHIRQALSARQFVLHFQPKVNMRTGKVIGAEALIRWQHPEHGLLPPSVFLPVIEDHPLAIEVGEWVIDSVLTQMEVWHAAGLNIPVSVNVGARQLQQHGFALRLAELLASHPSIQPCELEIEVLETSALEDLNRVAQIIDDCTALGVSFSLDDFGTGYSSLTYLKRLSVDQIKIDKSFVRNMRDDPNDLAILEGILGLASAFQRQAIAEGVESVEHGTMLLQLGCERAQGHGIACPMPAADLLDWVVAWRPDDAWSDAQPVSRDDLPLLFASAEHRAWVVALESHFMDEQSVPPPLDVHACRFGLWLDNEGQARYRAHPAFARIEALHREAHAVAAELCALRTHGKNPQILERLSELHGARDALLERLKALARKGEQQVP